MHTSKNTLLLFFCFYTIISLGQIKLDSIEQVLIKKNEYFNLQREVIHLHTNKTIYLTEEAIWFKAYIVDNKNHKPFAVTKNLYVTLYNENGYKVDHKLYLASNGFADGTFVIPKDLDSGNYILMASTAHQDNFREDERYYQQITIKNLSQPSITETTNELQKSYDIQILPEGGNLLAGIINTCGVKIIDQQGLGVQEVSSKLFTQNSKVPITEFKLNTFGMGKFSFTPSLNEKYYIISTIGNTEIKTEVPIQQRRGVLLTSSFHPTKPLLIVEISTNNKTLPTIRNKKFHILIHQYQKTKGLSASFTDETNVIELAIPLKDLPYGVNTISLFDEKHNPISERLIFNDTPNKLIVSDVIKSIIKKDSIVTSFRLKSKDTIVNNASLSVSILPAETISNINNQSIINSIYLQPFINSQVENPTYYFQNVTKRKKYNLDILLLTQGWSKYDWKSIFTSNTAPRLEHEDGITLKGSINKIMTPNTNLLITSKENQFTEILFPEKNKPLRNFILNNLTLRDSTKIQFVINDKKNQTTDANVKANVITFQPLDFNLKANKINPTEHLIKKNNDINSKPEILNKTQLFKTDEQLDEVLLIGKKSKKQRMFTGRIIPQNHRQYLDDNVKASLKNIRNYLYSKTFVFQRDENGQLIFGKSYDEKGKLIPYQLYINNQRTINIDFLQNLTLDIVDDIYIVERDLTIATSVRIFTSRKNFTQEKPLNSFLVTNGYQPKRKFYTPKYQSYDNLFFNQYGVLGWTPTIKKNTNNEYEFSFLNTLAQEAKIFIEGIDQYGNLISEIKIIQIPSNP